jgi:hypothetical protein
LSVDFTDVIDTIYDKIDSNYLKEYLNELVDEAKSSEKMMNEVENMVRQISMVFPGLGSTFEEFEDNVRNGKVVKIVELSTNIFRKSLTSGELKNAISKIVSAVDETIKTTVVPKKRKL